MISGEISWAVLDVTYRCSEMANTGFEEVVLDRPLHQMVVHRGLADLLILLDRLVIVTFDGGKVGDLEEVFVGKSGFVKK